MPPQINATLTRIRTATAATGGRDDWDTPGVEPAGAGADEWTGTIHGYYREKIIRPAGGPPITERLLIIDTADLDTLPLDTDDVLELTVEGIGAVTGRAMMIARAALAGIPRRLQTTRIDLEPR